MRGRCAEGRAANTGPARGAFEMIQCQRSVSPCHSMVCHFFRIINLCHHGPHRGRLRITPTTPWPTRTLSQIAIARPARLRFQLTERCPRRHSSSRPLRCPGLANADSEGLNPRAPDDGVTGSFPANRPDDPIRNSENMGLGKEHTARSRFSLTDGNHGQCPPGSTGVVRPPCLLSPSHFSVANPSRHRIPSIDIVRKKLRGSLLR